jgi:SNF family Na+-dependent transporter
MRTARHVLILLAATLAAALTGFAAVLQFDAEDPSSDVVLAALGAKALR